MREDRSRSLDRGTGPAVKVFVELTELAATADRAGLRDAVAELVDVGATGVSVSDHLFATEPGRSRAEHAEPGCDPLTTLAAVAGLTDRLELQTVVMNSAWLHPALLLRGFNQLALLVGGERVTAGLGAGWSTEEFEALGLTMPPFRPRMERLAEVLALARQLADGGPATFEGSTSSPASCRSRPARRARRGCSSAAARTGCWTWPDATSTCSTCTAIPGTAGWPAQPWPRRPPATCAGGP